MAPLDSIFAKKRDAYRHPLLRFLESAEPEDARVEVTRPKDILGFKPASIVIHWKKNGVEQPPARYQWDDELNAQLVRLGIRSVSLDAEKVRFNMCLRDALKRPEARFGDGFFNAVLVKVVSDSGFGTFPEVARVMRHVTSLDPHTGGQGYPDCREMIVGIISARAGELVEALAYPEAEGKLVLAGAMAQYLDERFTVTDRIRLGWTVRD